MFHVARCAFERAEFSTLRDASLNALNFHVARCVFELVEFPALRDYFLHAQNFPCCEDSLFNALNFPRGEMRF